MQISFNYGPLMFINYPSYYCIMTNITPWPINESCYLVRFSQLNSFTVHRLYWPSFVYWTFVYDTYAFWAEQTRCTSMTRSRKFPIKPVWMIVRFSQINFIEKITNWTKKSFGIRFWQVTVYSGFFSSPEHKVLRVSYCDRSLSVVRRRPSSVVRRASCVVRRP